MCRSSYRRLVLLAFEHHGPLSDRSLAWWAVDVLKMNKSTALHWRNKLKRGELLGEVKDRVERTPDGRLHKLWEITPRGRQVLRRS
jgi:hypothetical protein